MLPVIIFPFGINFVGLFFLIPTEYGFQSDLVSEYFLRLVVSL